MTGHGVWLAREDAGRVSLDMLTLWYALTIPGREVTPEMVARVRAYHEFFGPYDEDGNIGKFPRPAVP